LERINKKPLLSRAFGGHFTTIQQDDRSNYQDSEKWVIISAIERIRSKYIKTSGKIPQRCVGIRNSK
jgi:hypothetical protein